MSGTMKQIRDFMESRYSHYEKKAYERALHVIFDMPFEDLPLALNEVISLGPLEGYLMVYKIAEWRLLLGK